MEERQPEEPSEESLKEILESWAIGPPRDALEARLRQTFRSVARGRQGGRHRWLRGSVRVPVPILLGLVAACLTTTVLALRGRGPGASVQGPATAPGSATRSVSLVGFEPVPEPRLTVLPPGEQP